MGKVCFVLSLGFVFFLSKKKNIFLKNEEGRMFTIYVFGCGQGRGIFESGGVGWGVSQAKPSQEEEESSQEE